MKRRLSLGIATIGDPSIVLIDECGVEWKIIWGNLYGLHKYNSQKDTAVVAKRASVKLIFYKREFRKRTLVHCILQWLRR